MPSCVWSSEGNSNPRLFIGGYKVTLNVDFLRQAGVALIVNVAKNLDKVFGPKFVRQLQVTTDHFFIHVQVEKVNGIYVYNVHNVIKDVIVLNLLCHPHSNIRATPNAKRCYFYNCINILGSNLLFNCYNSSGLRVDTVLGIRTWDRRMVGWDESIELWVDPPLPEIDKNGPNPASFCFFVLVTWLIEHKFEYKW